MYTRMLKKACIAAFAVMTAIIILPGIKVLAATHFGNTSYFYSDGSRVGTFDGTTIDDYDPDSNAEIMIQFEGYGCVDEFKVDTAKKEVTIKNLVPDTEKSNDSLYFETTDDFKDYKFVFSGNNKFSRMDSVGSSYTIALTEGSTLAIDDPGEPAFVGNSQIKIGENTRVTLTNDDGDTVLNAGDSLPADYATKYYSTAIFVGLGNISEKTATLEYTTHEYTGKALEPTVSIAGLTSGTHYTVKYENNIGVGTAKVTIEGKGNYTGKLEKTFAITQAAIDNLKANATITDGTEFEYSGSAITPDVTIPGLTKDTDFTVAYANNTEPGTATVTITGKGNYTGSFTLEFTIKKAAEDEEEIVVDGNGSKYSVKTNGKEKVATFLSPKTKKETKLVIADNVTTKDNTKVPVTKVAPNACKKNTKLKSATIGNNVRDVGDNAFNGCSNLTTLKFGKRVENIGKGAARNCKKLKKTTIPASTKKIGANAFNGDSSLANLTINCKNLKSIGNGAIKKINPKATITLKGSAKQKKAALKLITNKKTGYKATMKIKK